MKTPLLAWPALRQLAWVGTASGPTPNLDAHQLLLAARVAAQAQEDAWQPLPGPQALPPVAPAETLPVIDAEGEHLLRQLLEDQYDWLLTDCFAGLAARGYRLPHDLAAAVLVNQADKTRNIFGPDEHLALVLGERGHWLTQRNPAWQELLSKPDETTWATDSTWRRRQFVRAGHEAAPDQTRDFLATHLPQLPASEQANVLRELRYQLGPADERLLTHYLHSADPDVRHPARELLARIPGNWLVEQLWAYGREVVTLQPSPTGELALRVALPAHWPEAWQQAGIERFMYGQEEKPLGWVQQLLSLIPPQRWSDYWQLPPEQVLRLATPLAIGPALLKAWAAATDLHGHPAWAMALVQAEVAGFFRPNSADYDRVYSPVHVLPPPAAEALLAYVPAGACLRDKAPPWQRVLLAVVRPWPEAILQRVLQLLADSLLEHSHLSFRITRQVLVRELRWATNPAHDELLLQRLTEFCQWKTAHHAMIESALAQLQLRHQLTQWLARLPPLK